MTSERQRRHLSIAALGAALEARSAPGALYAPAADGRLACHACAHRCLISDGGRGVCGVRTARAGALQVPWGYVARRYVRAVETNTVYHLLPGSRALTFGMYGCDLQCPYCHNAQLSQALRDHPAHEEPHDVTPEALVGEAIAAGCRVICAAYNEPMITAEWLRAVFGEARSRGLRTAIISDGHSTPEALDYVAPVTDVFRVDLKAYDDASYRRLGGALAPVLDSIAGARARGLWVEVVTLVVPGLNDDPAGLSRLAGTLRDIDADLPWHLNAFVPRFKMKDAPATPPLSIVSAAGSGYARGLRFVYSSNDPRLHELAHTRCPACRAVLIRRNNYQTVASDLDGGACPRCHTPIPGIW